ncbi:MAG: hypothetical protein H6871_02835 [Methylobacteriaceae bacterium]|nr:hypothetical protein [Methylobacteriaceae bacterium]MCC0001981.1 hypothetical protein [Methylobacteriaceae bacterium]
MSDELKREVFDRVAKFAFGKPLIDNNFRGVVAEAIVGMTLPSGWRWCSESWGGWDFEHSDGTRLEVKQSAARQSWKAPSKGPSERRFDIAMRTGHWLGEVWVDAPGRKAQIYVFAFHPLLHEAVDHRDPLQWEFYVVPAGQLPSSKSITIKRLRTFAKALLFLELGTAVENLRQRTESAPLSR